jgi:hypothetical protein
VHTYTDIPRPPTVFEYKAPGVVQGSRATPLGSFPTPHEGAPGLVLKREDPTPTVSPSAYIAVVLALLAMVGIEVPVTSSSTIAVPLGGVP